jgi:hypothetical protein
MNLFYLKRSKEELNKARILFDDFNNKTIHIIINHLIKSMDFIVDYLNKEHVDFLDLCKFKNKLNEVMGKDFLETYYYLNNLKNKSIRVLNPGNILIDGKRIEHVSKKHFHKLILKTIDYFNTVYEKTENGRIWV